MQKKWAGFWIKAELMRPIIDTAFMETRYTSFPQITGSVNVLALSVVSVAGYTVQLGEVYGYTQTCLGNDNII
jgi:hypothetical protein